MENEKEKQQGRPDSAGRTDRRGTGRTEGRRTGVRSRASKIRRILAGAVLAIAALAAVCGMLFLFLQLSGKSSLYGRADSSALVTTLSEMSVSLKEGGAGEETEDWQEGDIRG